MSTFRLILPVVLLLLAGTAARADYLPIPLADLFGGSELIVQGTIESVGEDSFTLQPAEVYKGSMEGGHLQVAKYRDWTGGRRWSAYHPGQTVLLFLRQPTPEEEGTNRNWRIRGLGGEGEMPISDGAIFPHGLNLDEFPRTTFAVDGGELYGYRFDFDDFESALTDYLNCFGASETDAGLAGESTQQCSDPELASYQEKSDLHRYLLSE